MRSTWQYVVLERPLFYIPMIMARNAVNSFVGLLHGVGRIEQTRLRVKVERDSALPVMRFMLEPLLQLQGLMGMEIQHLDQREICQSARAHSATIVALIESGCDDDLRVTEKWTYLKEAARRSLFCKDTFYNTIQDAGSGSAGEDEEGLYDAADSELSAISVDCFARVTPKVSR